MVGVKNRFCNIRLEGVSRFVFAGADGPLQISAQLPFTGLLRLRLTRIRWLAGHWIFSPGERRIYRARRGLIGKLYAKWLGQFHCPCGSSFDSLGVIRKL